jgi:drug/metabolite transporter (DMT)-like permease
LSAGGVIGIIVIVLGLVIVGSSGWFGPDAGNAPRDLRSLLKGVWPALLMAVIISIYSVIDGAAVKRTEPLSYAGLVYFVSSLYMTPYVLKKNGWTAMKQEFGAYHWRLIITGALIVSSYLLALWAYRMASVSYSGAIREVGVVMGALAGWQFLGEKSGALRVTGSVVIFAGILVIAIFG